MTMTRRSTIGDNPLDSIGASPSGSPGPHAADAHKPGPGAKRLSHARTPAHDQEAPQPSASHWLLSPFRRRSIRLVGGDVASGVTRLSQARPGEQTSLTLPGGEVIHLKRDIVGIEVQSEDAARHVDALLAWATAGAFLAGPLGALAGSLYGGREHRSTALDVRLHDGRHILMVTSPETAQEMQAELS